MKFLLVFFVLLALRLEAAAPEWFSDYVKTNPGCEQDFLCAVGEGSTPAEALSEARSEVAKFFQTKVKSKSQMSLSSEQKGTNAGSASFDEWTNKTVSEETSEMISGLEIKRQEEINGRIYVLMGLDREKSAKALKEKIDVLDSENSKAMELNSRFTYPKILKNLALIEALGERYNLISHSPLKLRVKREHVREKINKLRPMNLAMVTKGKKLPARLSHTLIDLLSPLKIIIVSRKSAPKYILRSEIIAEEQYFKVDGFKKLNVFLRIELLNSNSVVMGKISALSEQVARTVDQAVLQAMPELKENLQDNLDQLTNLKMED